MKEKISDLIVEIITYYLAALLVSLIFARIGWVNGNIFLYSLAITIGWFIAKFISGFLKRKNSGRKER